MYTKGFSRGQEECGSMKNGSLYDPTYGVDPAARETIFNSLQDAAARGVCVLFFSSEPEQLVRICDRVIVLSNGKIVKELAGDENTLEIVTEWSYQ